MASAVFLITDDFEDSEFRIPYDRLRIPYDRLRDAGHDVTVAGPSGARGREVTGKKGKERLTLEAAAGDLEPAAFDVLVLPGGYSPDRLRTDEAAVGFVRAFAGTGKPLAAVCHAGSLLIEAGAVDGRRLTSWPSIRTDLENAGAKWEDSEVVVDDNLITSRKPDDLDAFCGAILEALGSSLRRSGPP